MYRATLKGASWVKLKASFHYTFAYSVEVDAATVMCCLSMRCCECVTDFRTLFIAEESKGAQAACRKSRSPRLRQ